MNFEESTNSSIWPSSKPPPEIKHLVNRFFALVDTCSEETGQMLANTIFTQDGLFITANDVFQGAAEISQSRKGAWTTVRTRQHTILKVYVNDASSMDLVIVGNLKMETLAGAKTKLEFVARMELEEQESMPKIRKYQVVSPAPKGPQSIIVPK